ncbi:MAG: hypothetical protein R3A48_23205 [Polyangiales bacterium]
MGFGPGLYLPGRDEPITNSYSANAPWTLLSPEHRTLVVSPAGTPAPLREPRTGVEAIERARLLVDPTQQGATPARTLVGDARDLLLWTLRRANVAGLDADSQVCARESFSTGALRRYDDSVPARGDVEIHVGWTFSALQMLTESHPAVEGAPSDSLYREHPPPTHIDADGFVCLARQAADRIQVVLAGGGDYGTYFAVVWFLRKLCDAEWLLPGPLGFVVTDHLGSALVAPAGLSRLVEPWIRSRTLDGLANSGLTLGEIDQLRDWSLRNFLRPGNCRPFMRQQLRQLEACALLDPTQPSSNLWRSEERFSAAHNQNQLLSPTSLTALTGGAGDLRLYQVAPELFPDTRLRFATTEDDSLEALSRLGCEAPAPWLRPDMRVGSVLAATRLRYTGPQLDFTQPVQSSTPAPTPCSQLAATADRFEDVPGLVDRPYLRVNVSPPEPHGAFDSDVIGAIYRPYVNTTGLRPL